MYKIENFTARADADKMHHLCFNMDTGCTETLLIYIESYGLLGEEELNTLKELFEKAENNSELNMNNFDRGQFK